jgi:hypothetical protein
MSRVLLCAVAALAGFHPGSLDGQTYPDPFASAFNSAAIEYVQFNLDVPDTIVQGMPVAHRVIYRDPVTTVWDDTVMTELYQACSVYTYSATVELNTSSSYLEWYNHSESDTLVVTQSPKNGSNVFPVPQYLLADLGADPVGDVEGAAGTFLDITHCYASYSDARLYFRLDNNGGGFPTSSGFTFFLYSIGILDPDASDSAAYALLYANVPFLLSPGLYKIDLADSSFTNIGDIQYNISGNSLSMSCGITDLTAQPGWSDWPPPSGFIGVAPITATQTLSGLAPNDMGKAVLYLPESHTADFLFNQTPVLSDGMVELSDSFYVSASVVFMDLDGHLAVIRSLHFGTDLYPMTACEKDYVSGTLFEATFEIDSTAWYRYFFEFSDGVETVTTALDSIYMELPYVPGDADGSGAVDIDDVVYLIAYIFTEGPPPDPMAAGDADCSGSVDIDDVVYLIDYIFGDGPPPCRS